jgi:hypothetical protein
VAAARWTILAGPGQRRYPRQVEGPPYGRPGRPDRQPITGPQPVTRGSAPIGAPPAVRTVGGQADQPHGGVATPVGKINYPASTPMATPRSCFAWTGEHSRGLADTHRDSSVPIETQIGKEFFGTSSPLSRNVRFQSCGTMPEPSSKAKSGRVFRRRAVLTGDASLRADEVRPGPHGIQRADVLVLPPAFGSRAPILPQAVGLGRPQW